MSKKKLESKNLYSTNISKLKINDATDEEWNKLIQNRGMIDWDSNFNIDTGVDIIAKVINNIEKEVKDENERRLNMSIATNELSIYHVQYSSEMPVDQVTQSIINKEIPNTADFSLVQKAQYTQVQSSLKSLTQKYSSSRFQQKDNNPNRQFISYFYDLK